MSNRGQPKRFSSGSNLIKLFGDFCESVREDNFKIVPTQTNFCRWLSKEYGDVDRRTIYNSLNKYFPGIKKEFEDLQGDLVAEGAMLGKYKETMSIFALKHWCKWSDRQQFDLGAEAPQIVLGVRVE